MIFGRRNYDGLEFKIGEHTISICDEFKYLGVVFSKSRSFYKAIKHNTDHSKKAIYLLYKHIRNLNIPMDLHIELFNHTRLPILLYIYIYIYIYIFFFMSYRNIVHQR